MLKIGQDLAGLFLETPVCQRLPLGIDRQLSRNHHKPTDDTEVSIVPRGRTDGATVKLSICPEAGRYVLKKIACRAGGRLRERATG